MSEPEPVFCVACGKFHEPHKNGIGKNEQDKFAWQWSAKDGHALVRKEYADNYDRTHIKPYPRKKTVEGNK